MKNVTVTGFCVTSSGALPNSASNSLRLIQALANRRLLESSELELLGSDASNVAYRQINGKPTASFKRHWRLRSFELRFMTIWRSA